MENKELHDTCDKICNIHGEHKLLLSQHSERINRIELEIDAVNVSNSNTEGRLNMFIWAIGIVFMLIVSMSFYGVIQLNDFKNVYTEDNMINFRSISKLNNSITITNNNMQHIKDDVEILKNQSTKK